MDVETRELLAIKATKGRNAFDAMLFLVLKKCTNKPTFVVDVHGIVGFLSSLSLIIITFGEAG